MDESTRRRSSSGGAHTPQGSVDGSSSSTGKIYIQDGTPDPDLLSVDSMYTDPQSHAADSSSSAGEIQDCTPVLQLHPDPIPLGVDSRSIGTQQMSSIVKPKRKTYITKDGNVVHDDEASAKIRTASEDPRSDEASAQTENNDIFISSSGDIQRGQDATVAIAFSEIKKKVSKT